MAGITARLASPIRSSPIQLESAVLPPGTADPQAAAARRYAQCPSTSAVAAAASLPVLNCSIASATVPEAPV